MMKKKILFAVLVLGCLHFAAKADRLPKETREALQKYSICFDSVVNNYYAGGFVGNGLMGAMVYKEKGDTLCWELGRADVADHRPGNVLFFRCRLPIGKLQLPMGGKSSDMLINLEKAEVCGKFGTVNWKCFTPACRNVLIIEWNGEGDIPEIGFVPAISQSPRLAFKGEMYKAPDGYTGNPPAQVYQNGDYQVCKQSLLGGGEYSTVWKVISEKNKKKLILSIEYSQTNTDTDQTAIRNIEEVISESAATIRKEHQAWWDKFYSKSAVSVGEDKFDSFYWTQLYKLGSATRENRLPIDLMGPWYHHRTPWPAIWWNLNIQLTYSPMFAINHSELVQPLLEMLDKNVENLKKNVPAKFANSAAMGRSSSYDCVSNLGNEHGLLVWTMLYYWKYCQYEQDTERLKTKFFPLMKLAVNYYRYLLIEGDDGFLHMPVSYSPEYGEAADCNFELSLLRWGCSTLIKAAEICGLTNDSLVAESHRILNRLTPYPVDQDGFMIGKDVKLTYGHRHYSHLLMLYPLANLPLDVPENAELAKRSILYWLGFKGGYQGYTYTGASSMSTLLGDGEKARSYLKVMLDRFLQPNTFYRESGPVFETPMSGLASFTEMLLLSQDSVIQVCPAVPEEWKNIHYTGLRAEGGFEVDVDRVNGVTREIRVHSLFGLPCVVKCDIPEKQMKIKGGEFEMRGDKGIRLYIPKGKTMVIRN